MWRRDGRRLHSRQYSWCSLAERMDRGCAGEKLVDGNQAEGQRAASYRHVSMCAMRLPGVLCAACLTSGRNAEAVERSTHPTSREVPGGRLADSELPSPPPPADILNLRLTDDPIILRAVRHTAMRSTRGTGATGTPR